MSIFQLPALSYAYNSLSQWIDPKTMEIHHTKHHQAYINKLKATLEKENITNYPTQLTDFLKQVSTYRNINIQNNLGGHYNHTLFWKILSPQQQKRPIQLDEAIQKNFGSYDNFQKEFTQKALTQFGSGWAWLALNKKGELFVSQTANQDNPLMDSMPSSQQGTPILALDLWEHAYYLTYQNKRADYIQAFFQVINWNNVAQNYKEALAQC